MRSIEVQVVVENCNHAKAIEVSRYLKTKCRSLVRGDFWYLDGDIIAVKSLQKPCMANSEILACVKDRDHSTNIPIVPQAALDMVQSMQWDCHYEKYYNSGVVFFPDKAITHKFAARWCQLWCDQLLRTGEHRDQYSFNVCISEMRNPVCELDDIYNCLVINDKNFTSRSIILHFYSSLSNRSSPSLLTYLTEHYRCTGKFDHDVFNRAVKARLVWAQGIKWNIAQRECRQCMVSLLKKLHLK